MLMTVKHKCPEPKLYHVSICGSIKYVDETLKCENSNASFSVALSYGNVSF